MLCDSTQFFERRNLTTKKSLRRRTSQTQSWDGRRRYRLCAMHDFDVFFHLLSLFICSFIFQVGVVCCECVLWLRSNNFRTNDARDRHNRSATNICQRRKRCVARECPDLKFEKLWVRQRASLWACVCALIVELRLTKTAQTIASSFGSRIDAHHSFVGTTLIS